MRVLVPSLRVLVVAGLATSAMTGVAAAADDTVVAVGSRYADGSPLVGMTLCAGEGCLAADRTGTTNMDTAGNGMITVPVGTVVEFGSPELYRGGNRTAGSSYHRIVATAPAGDRRIFTFPAALTPGVEPAAGPEERRLLDLIHAARRTAGVQRLEDRAALAIAADEQATWLARGGTVGPTGEHGSSAFTRVTFAGVTPRDAQNVTAVDAGSADAAFAKLMGDPATRATLLDSLWAAAGVGAVRGRWDVTLVSSFLGCAYGCPMTPFDPQASAFALTAPVAPVPTPAPTPGATTAPGARPACRVRFRSAPKAVRVSRHRVRVSLAIRPCPGVRTRVGLRSGTSVRTSGVRRAYTLTTRRSTVRLRLIAGGRTVDARTLRVRSR